MRFPFAKGGKYFFNYAYECGAVEGVGVGVDVCNYVCVCCFL